MALNSPPTTTEISHTAANTRVVNTEILIHTLVVREAPEVLEVLMVNVD